MIIRSLNIYDITGVGSKNTIKVHDVIHSIFAKSELTINNKGTRIIIDEFNESMIEFKYPDTKHIFIDEDTLYTNLNKLKLRYSEIQPVLNYILMKYHNIKIDKSVGYGLLVKHL